MTSSGVEEELEQELLLALTKVKVTPNNLGGLHYEVPDESLDRLQALIATQKHQHTIQVLEGLKKYVGDIPMERGMADAQYVKGCENERKWFRDTLDAAIKQEQEMIDGTTN